MLEFVEAPQVREVEVGIGECVGIAPGRVDADRAHKAPRRIVFEEPRDLVAPLPAAGQPQSATRL